MGNVQPLQRADCGDEITIPDSLLDIGNPGLRYEKAGAGRESRLHRANVLDEEGILGELSVRRGVGTHEDHRACIRDAAQFTGHVGGPSPGDRLVHPLGEVVEPTAVPVHRGIPVAEVGEDFPVPGPEGATLLRIGLGRWNHCGVPDQVGQDQHLLHERDAVKGFEVDHERFRAREFQRTGLVGGAHEGGSEDRRDLTHGERSQALDPGPCYRARGNGPVSFGLVSSGIRDVWILGEIEDGSRIAEVGRGPCLSRSRNRRSGRCGIDVRAKLIRCLAVP